MQLVFRTLEGSTQGMRGPPASLFLLTSVDPGRHRDRLRPWSLFLSGHPSSRIQEGSISKLINRLPTVLVFQVDVHIAATNFDNYHSDYGDRMYTTIIGGTHKQAPTTLMKLGTSVKDLTFPLRAYGTPGMHARVHEVDTPSHLPWETSPRFAGSVTNDQ